MLQALLFEASFSSCHSSSVQFSSCMTKARRALAAAAGKVRSIAVQ
jgi:hypothetical protein